MNLKQILRDTFNNCICSTCSEAGTGKSIHIPNRTIRENTVIYSLQSEECKSIITDETPSNKTSDCVFHIVENEICEEQIIITELKSRSNLSKGIDQLQNVWRWVKSKLRDAGITNCFMSAILYHDGIRNKYVFQKKVASRKLTTLKNARVSIKVIQYNNTGSGELEYI